MTALTAKTRALVVGRDEGRCVGCGQRSTQVQHRQRRGMGGTTRIDSPAGLIVLCGSGTTGCHGWVTCPPPGVTRADVEATGWEISRAADPLTVPVWHYRWGWIMLLADGLWRHDAFGPPPAVLPPWAREAVA